MTEKKRPGRQTRYPGVKDLGGGRYRVRVTRRTPDGKQTERERVVEAESVQAAAQKKLDLERELAGEETPPPALAIVAAPASTPSRLLGDAAREWLRQRVDAKRPDGTPRLCPTTCVRYTGSVEQVIAPSIGRVVRRGDVDVPATIDALIELDIETWRDKLGEHFAASTVNGHLVVLRMILRSVGRRDLCDVRGLPEDDTRITDEEPNSLDEAELARFLVEAQRLEPEHYALILVLFTTGMRISTALALERSDFEPERERIVARRRRSGKVIVPGVKRKRTAVDVVPLLPVVWAEVESEWEVHTDLQQVSELAFPSERTGGYRAKSALDKPLRRICEAAGITKRFTPHGCRRTCVDLLTKVAGQRVAMAVAGHLTTEMNRHYSRVADAEKQAASQAVMGRLRLVGGNAGVGAGDPGAGDAGAGGGVVSVGAN